MVFVLCTVINVWLRPHHLMGQDSNNVRLSSCLKRCQSGQCIGRTIDCYNCSKGYKNPPEKQDCDDMAYKRPVLASPKPDLWPDLWNASHVVDGKVIDRPLTLEEEKRLCYHSKLKNNDKFPKWWQVDLGSTVSIKWLTLVTRFHCCQFRMDHFQIHVSNISMTKGSYNLPRETSVCHRHGEVPWEQPVNLSDATVDITCDDIVNGRYLIVYVNNTHRTMNFCQLTVYKCLGLTFGRNCEHHCKCARSDGDCNIITGACSSGCAKGYQGENCSQECDDGSYGYNCSKICRCQNTSEACDKFTGECLLSGCTVGYMGDNCQIPCRPRKFGSDCLKTCHCDNKYMCSPFTGICYDKNCSAGWKSKHNGPAYCDEACAEGKFGKNCIHKCHCNHNTTCSRFTGVCSDMQCAAGWKSEKTRQQNCQELCQNGKFGHNCSKQCRCLDPNEVCDKATGECLQTGCTAGFKGKDCQTPCKHGTFGENCFYTCHCKDNENCSRFTGVCFHEVCAAGWTSSQNNLQNCQEVVGIPGYGVALICITIVGVIVVAVFLLRKYLPDLQKKIKTQEKKIPLPNTNDLLPDPNRETALQTTKNVELENETNEKQIDDFDETSASTYN